MFSVVANDLFMEWYESLERRDNRSKERSRGKRKDYESNATEAEAEACVVKIPSPSSRFILQSVMGGLSSTGAVGMKGIPSCIGLAARHE